MPSHLEAHKSRALDTKLATNSGVYLSTNCTPIQLPLRVTSSFPRLFERHSCPWMSILYKELAGYEPNELPDCSTPQLDSNAGGQDRQTIPDSTRLVARLSAGGGADARLFRLERLHLF